MSTERDTILMDVDGVLVDHNRYFLSRINLEFGTQYEYEGITHFGYGKFMKPEHASRVYELWHSDDLYDDAVLSQECLNALDEMREFARVVACTTPMTGHATSKLGFLERYFQREDIVFAGDKTLVRGDVLVDDALHNVESFPGATVLFHKPWNKSVDYAAYDWRAFNWEDVCNFTRAVLRKSDATELEEQGWHPSRAVGDVREKGS